MKRTLLAAAALLAAAPAFAQSSNVTLYGIIGVDYLNATKVYNATTGTLRTVNRLDDNAIVNSRFGLKGSEALGGGTSAVFGLEASVRPDTGTVASTFWNRGSYVGLTGDFGSVKFGRQWDVADDYMGKYFVFGYYSPFLFGDYASLSNLYNNAIKYNSPVIGGFQGGVFYGFGEQPGSVSTNQVFQAAAAYDVGPFSIGLTSYSDKGTPSRQTMNAGGLAYNFGVLNTRLGFAAAKTVTPGSPDVKSRLFDVGVDVPITAAASASLDWVKRDLRDSASDTSYVRLRGTYALSKRTSLNANLIFLRNTGAANFAFVTDGNGFAGSPGQKQRILTTGITHSF